MYLKEKKALKVHKKKKGSNPRTEEEDIYVFHCCVTALTFFNTRPPQHSIQLELFLYNILVLILRK
jgi:hypothetical protein